MIDSTRIQYLNDRTIQKGQYVVYWMQASQRTRHNLALDYAIQKANKLNIPLLVYFELIDNFPDANLRHYHFMLEGLQQVQADLLKKNIQFIINYQQLNQTPNFTELAQNSACIIMDCGYLRMQKSWRKKQAKQIQCACIQVEDNVVVPVELAYPKQAYSAAVLRKSLDKLIPNYLIHIKSPIPKHPSLHFEFSSFDISNLSKALSRLQLDRTVQPSLIYHGGQDEAQKHLSMFLKQDLSEFAEYRNDPSKNIASHLSPYLHFGQISPIDIVLKIKEREIDENKKSFLEELIVRRELAMNFVYYNPDYDQYKALPDWAKKTLNEHKKDHREYLYTLEQLEKTQTHDPYWNAAQKEMCITGKMHGYMRMYWGKKIIEWSQTPEEAFRTALYLNNKYELDGRDPNGFTGVAWCFGLHDRPWQERPIFGKIRYMNAKGLERKFNIQSYVDSVSSWT